MNSRPLWFGTLAAAVFSAGCATTPSVTSTQPPASSPAQEAPKRAGTQLESRSGSSVTGTARFAQTEQGVEAQIEVSGASEGKRGLHLHEKGDCSAADASSAGPHWNPAGESHGDLHAPSHHAGDLGNITIDAEGKGQVRVTNPSWSIGPVEGKHDILGRAVVVHGAEDDLQSQPAGNAGPRQACGVIEAE
ncbi:MAG: superoxide dismutase family protein [Myxococcota bacterium]|nr:superoxide dismutase family protein [Myxococcota bacterium]